MPVHSYKRSDANRLSNHLLHRIPTQRSRKRPCRKFCLFFFFPFLAICQKEGVGFFFHSFFFGSVLSFFWGGAVYIHAYLLGSSFEFELFYNRPSKTSSTRPFGQFLWSFLQSIDAVLFTHLSPAWLLIVYSFVTCLIINCILNASIFHSALVELIHHFCLFPPSWLCFLYDNTEPVPMNNTFSLSLSVRLTCSICSSLCVLHLLSFICDQSVYSPTPLSVINLSLICVLPHFALVGQTGKN